MVAGGNQWQLAAAETEGLTRPRRRDLPPSRPSCEHANRNRAAANILEVIGDTPLVRINRITKGTVAADVYAKIETFNPGNSIKDRMAVKMVEDAEQAAS